MTGPHWIKQWIADLALLNESFRDENGTIDFESLGREEFLFRTALITRKLDKSERAKVVFEQAAAAYQVNVERGKKGGRPKKSPQDAQNGNAGVDMSDAGNGAASKSPTSCDTFTADASTREDSQDRKSGTSANIYGPRQANCRPEDGNPAETAPSHGGSVASLEARQGQALESRRTGGSSVRGMAKVAQPSVRSRASFRNKEDFIQWAIDDGLDPVDADECWEATEERSGKDADGNTVKNMKAFARQWCRTRDYNRRKNRRNA